MSEENSVKMRKDFFSLVDQLIKSAGEIYAGRDTLTPDICLKLYQLFGTTFRGCLDLLDEKAITKLKAKLSKRVVYQVRSDSGSSYFILPFSNRCCCKAWLYRTWQNHEVLTCKHILAARIAESFDQAKSLRGDDDDQGINCLKIEYLEEDAFIDLIANID